MNTTNALLQRTPLDRAQRAYRLLQDVGLERVHRSLADSDRVAGTLDPRDTETRQALSRLLETGRDALERAATQRSSLTSFSGLEVQALEAIVLTVGRPAILIRDDQFDTPPQPWEILEQFRPSIEARLASVGRIEVTGHPSLDWVGTGFLIAPGVVVTNRHVVQEFALPDWQGRWRMDAGMQVRIDFAEEIENPTAREFRIDLILGVHSRLDIALLQIAADERAGLPPPLQLDGGGVALAPDRPCYVIGYPALDSRRNDALTLQRIFNNIYNVKRLQPGLLKDWSGELAAYLHDCSTLGGNSGSCLVDLASGNVIGIHFGGRFGEANWAISSRDLAGDPTLARFGAQFF